MQGILIVDKPMDWTSFDVIAKLRGIPYALTIQRFAFLPQ